GVTAIIRVRLMRLVVSSWYGAQPRRMARGLPRRIIHRRVELVCSPAHPGRRPPATKLGQCGRFATDPPPWRCKSADRSTPSLNQTLAQGTRFETDISPDNSVGLAGMAPVDPPYAPICGAAALCV